MANQKPNQHRPEPATSATKPSDDLSGILTKKFGKHRGLVLNGVVTSSSIRDFTSDSGAIHNVLEAVISDGGKIYQYSKRVNPAQGETLPELNRFDCVQVRVTKCSAGFGEVRCEGGIEVV